MITVFLLILTTVYLLLTLLLHKGLAKKYKMVDITPPVSVIIAARNEESNINACLQSLARLDYPQEYLEIIIADDDSADGTLQMIQEFIKNRPNFRCLRINRQPETMQGKMNALAQAIEQASGEILLITDADCRVQVGWVKNTVKYFTDRTGLCGNMTVLVPAKRTPTLFDRVQNLDWIFLQAIASATTGIGKPVSVLGNNFAFRRDAYRQCGGFHSMPFSVTEDMQLLQEILKKTEYSVVYPLDPEAFVLSEPVDTVTGFFQQRKRWTVGGKKTRPWGIFLLATAFVTHLSVLTALIAPPFTAAEPIAVFLILAADISLLIRVLIRIDKIKWLTDFFFFEIFYLIYSLVFAFIFIFVNDVSWKGRVHSPQKKGSA